MISGARRARPSWLRRLVARAASQELAVFVVPGPEVARARGLDLGAANLCPSPTPRHANVLLVVGELPEELKKAAVVAYAQMPRPRAVLALDNGDVSPLPKPDVSVGLDQDALISGVAELRRLFADGAFDPGATVFEAAALRSRTEYVCSMHPTVVQGEPGACPKCGMELVARQAEDGDEERDAHRGHEGHDHTQHKEMAYEGGTDEGEEGHDHGDHGDMGFMSMVEMTQDLPRSSDGLQMEWVETPFGPLFPGLPGGLALTFTLDGDTVARAEAGSAVYGWAPGELGDSVRAFADRLARLDPLSPVSYHLLALRAVEDAVGAQAGEDTTLARVGALERERAASHLNWLASFGRLIGYGWLARRAEELQLALLRADIEMITPIWEEVQKLVRRAERTPLLRRKLVGVGELPDSVEAAGPVARASGRGSDARVDEEAYRGLGFEPVVFEGGDALARLRVRLAEVEQSLELVRRAGETSVPDTASNISLSGKGSATVETPRGAATLKVTLQSGKVTGAGLETPSAKHIGLISAATEQREVADALVGVASLDLSPWGMAG